jgi:serine/threonine-protein kinase
MPQRLGRYTVVRELGKGAMGVVYEGRDPNIERRVAIKTARRDVMASSGMADEMMERFLREARAAGALNHPNIITIYDAGEENGIAYIAMEFLEGGDLREVIDERRRLDVPEIVDIGAQVCDALAAAHEKGIIHRDIKPANIMVPKGGPLKLADFGIAHVSDSTLTQDGALIGTPHYMSPEQFMGQKLDGRSDLFSVGVILYEMLTGEKPFTGEALSTVMHHVIRTQPAPPSELNFNVPDTLSMVVMKAMSKRSADRYADGRTMATALRESLKPNPDPAVLGFDAQAAADKTTVSATGPATVVMQGPPPGEATRVMDTPAERAAAATVTISGPATAGLAPAPPGKPKTVLVGAGVLAAVVVLAGVYFALRGGSTPPPTGETALANTGQPYYGSISFRVWRAKTPEAYQDYQNNLDLGSVRDNVEFVQPPISVEVRDGQGALVGSSKNYVSGDKLILDNQPKTLKWIVGVGKATDDGELGPNQDATDPAEELSRTVVLPPLPPT